ncbi:response regulator transcription factor [Bifidobacterium biavatii]|uniref:Heme response regulator HssR n=1 Tax=Bifidobacterium biavatii DSM 23969 TaxID=1437608 RepID=A0A087A4V4_9BIFI|nr:response regulator transcription factor [Bifidobacterium biavatii]KFI53804.1 transcriptional regulator [Bifidobacterium biavatii DSM 23969]
MTRLLVVEDEKALNDITCDTLRDAGYDVTGCLNANRAFDAMRGTLYDLVICDIMMPGIDGYELTSRIRAVDENIPIIFTTGRDDIMSKRRGFRAGIDDYMVKPVDLDELVLRVEALLRRSRIAESRRLAVGAFMMDADQMTATLNGEEIALATREFSILYRLLSYPRQVFSRAQLMDEFWDSAADGNLRAVDVYITKLRQKLARCTDFEIVTIRGIGYKAVPR